MKKVLQNVLVALFTLIITGVSSHAVQLSDEQIENLVRRSYPYVAIYHLHSKFAMDETIPTCTGGWNKKFAAAGLLDHTMKTIARPNNDTLYVNCMLDLRTEPVIVDFGLARRLGCPVHRRLL